MSKAIVIGGAGFVGQNLVEELLNQNYSIIITRSSVKKTFFSENEKIRFSSFEEIKNENIDVIYNLAFSSSASLINVVAETNKLFYNIKNLCLNNNIEKIIQISSIVLNNYMICKPIFFSDIYTYSKYLQENKIKRLKKLTEVKIIRIGNVIGLGGPWYEQIIDSFYRSIIITYRNTPSNATHVKTLSKFLVKMDSSKKLTLTYAELGNIYWSELLPSKMNKLIETKKTKTNKLKKIKFMLIKYLSSSSRYKYLIDFIFSFFKKTIFQYKESVAIPKDTSNLHPKDSYSQVFYDAKALVKNKKVDLSNQINFVRSEIDSIISGK